MAERIVNELESIEVEHKNGEPVTIPLSVDDFAVEPIHEEYSIRKTRERVMGGLMLQLRVGHLESSCMSARSRLQMGVVYRSDQRHDQQTQREHTDRCREPA